MEDKIVIFDWGGVVESHENNLLDLKKSKIRMIQKYNSFLSGDEILRRWSNKTSTGILIDTTNKKEDIRDWVNLIQKNMNIKIPFDEFKKSYEEESSSVKYYKDVVEYAHSLKDKCKIGILSNLMCFDQKRIDAQYNLNKFDYVYLSFEIGMKKPNREIYEYVLNDLKAKPEKILFIDDVSENILMAKQCGWNVCQAYGYELDKIKKAVNDFLDIEC